MKKHLELWILAGIVALALWVTRLPAPPVAHAQPYLFSLATYSNRIDLASTSTGQAGASFIPPRSITIVRFLVFALTPAATCSTSAVLSIRDTTASVNLANATLTNTTANVDSGVISVNVPIGDTIMPFWTTGASGCGTNPSGVTWTAEYQ